MREIEYDRVPMDHDEHGFDCRLRIQASFGGVEARHFAGMLLRMYSRWAERAGLRHEIDEVVDGEEGGIERATLKLAGEGVLERVGGEHGYHRLVRIPPGEERRSASFAIVEVAALPEDGDVTSPVDTSQQVRTYVLHPAESVTDDRTGHRTADAQAVLDGDLGAFIPAAPADRA